MDTVTQTSESEYLGITEAADYLRVSASTLRRWEKKGFLVPERTPTGIRRYTKKQLDDVIQTPAYEKPSVTPVTPVATTIDPAAVQLPSEPLVTPSDLTAQTAVHVPEPEEDSVDEYIQVIEPGVQDELVQHSIDSQLEIRPSSYTSMNIEHAYTPLEYSSHTEKKVEEPVYHAPEPVQTAVPTPVTEEPRPIKQVASDNFSTIEQEKFNHIFDLQDTNDEVELEEYDTDAAYVSDEPRSSTYTYSPREAAVPRNQEKKRSAGWVKPIFLFVSLFLAIVIISLVAWFAFSSSSVSGAPLNPVID